LPQSGFDYFAERHLITLFSAVNYTYTEKHVCFPCHSPVAPAPLPPLTLLARLSVLPPLLVASFFVLALNPLSGASFFPFSSLPHKPTIGIHGRNGFDQHQQCRRQDPLQLAALPAYTRSAAGNGIQPVVRRDIMALVILSHRHHTFVWSVVDDATFLAALFASLTIFGHRATALLCARTCAFS